MTITAAQLLAALQEIPEDKRDLPIVFAWDCWQTRLYEDSMPKLALWNGESVGAPVTAEKLEDEREYMGDDYCDRFNKECVAIGHID